MRWSRVREAAKRDKRVRFTALLHHVYNVEHLGAAYFALKRDAAPGIDGETWGHYGEALEANLADLSGRLKRGAYRAKPVKRTYIPKADGRQRPLGIPTLEDKLVQRTTPQRPGLSPPDGQLPTRAARLAASHRRVTPTTPRVDARGAAVDLPRPAARPLR